MSNNDLIMNIDLIMNPSIAPVYITTTNMVMPILTITNKAISNIILTIVSTAASIIVELMIIMKALKYFILREISNISFDSYKLFITGIMLITFGLMFTNKIAIIHIQTQLNKRIQLLECQINYMNKTERMRENDWDLLMHSYTESFKILQDDFNKKFSNYKKQFKKIDKELKMYQ
jgi:hypothetical protein